MRFPYIYEIMDGDKPVKRYKNWLSAQRWATTNLPADPRVTIRGFSSTTGKPTGYLARRMTDSASAQGFKLEHGHHYPVSVEGGIDL